jgi:hypothetical protein
MCLEFYLILKVAGAAVFVKMIIYSLVMLLQVIGVRLLILVTQQHGFASGVAYS